METIVLVKQVPDTEAAIEVTSDATNIEGGSLNWVLNPYDEIAVEEGLRIKEALGGTVTVLSVGPKRCEEALRSGLAMGADRAVLINDEGVEAWDHQILSAVVAACIKDMEYDLILTGQRAVDDDLQVVGASVAKKLGIPYIPYVTGQEIEDGTIRCVQSTDRDMTTVEAALPALVAAQRGLNDPRYISLPGMMKAKKKPVEVKTLDVLSIDPDSLPQPLSVVEILEVPPSQRAGEIIGGETAKEQVDNLVARLKEMAVI